MTQRSGANGSLPSAAAAAAAATLNGNGNGNGSGGETSRFKVQSAASSDRDSQSNEPVDRRPSSAPGRKNGDAKDDHSIEPERPTRPAKPVLQRSKSEYAPRQVEESDHEEDEIREWGARHGFEDHYQSEHIISQLANVRCLQASVTYAQISQSP
jgi:regulator-associated protein of mTOR